MLYLLQSNHVVIHQINLNAGLVMTYLDIVVKKSQPKTGKLSWVVGEIEVCSLFLLWESLIKMYLFKLVAEVYLYLDRSIKGVYG